MFLDGLAQIHMDDDGDSGPQGAPAGSSSAQAPLRVEGDRTTCKLMTSGKEGRRSRQLGRFSEEFSRQIKCLAKRSKRRLESPIHRDLPVLTNVAPSSGTDRKGYVKRI